MRVCTTFLYALAIVKLYGTTFGDNYFLRNIMMMMTVVVVVTTMIMIMMKTMTMMTTVAVGLPDLPYFPGAPVFRPLPPVSRTEAKISRI